MNLRDRGLRPNLRYYPGIFLERVTESTKALSQDNQSLYRESYQGTAAYEAGMQHIDGND
jgi:hypothetical protein